MEIKNGNGMYSTKEFRTYGPKKPKELNHRLRRRGTIKTNEIKEVPGLYSGTTKI